MDDRSPVPAWLDPTEVEPTRHSLGFLGRLALAVQCYHTPGVFAETAATLAAYQETIDAGRAEIARLRRQLARAEEDHADAEARASRSDADAYRYRQRASLARKQVETVNREVDSLHQQLDGKDATIRALRVSLAQHRDVIGELDQALLAIGAQPET